MCWVCVCWRKRKKKKKVGRFGGLNTLGWWREGFQMGDFEQWIIQKFTLEHGKRRLHCVNHCEYLSLAVAIDQQVYMAHSSLSSASEMNGSSIALIARSPHRMLFAIVSQKTKIYRSRMLTIGQRPKHLIPSPPSLSFPLAQSEPVAHVFLPLLSIHFRPTPSSPNNHYEIHADNLGRRRIAY